MVYSSDERRNAHERERKRTRRADAPGVGGALPGAEGEGTRTGQGHVPPGSGARTGGTATAAGPGRAGTSRGHRTGPGLAVAASRAADRALHGTTWLQPGECECPGVEPLPAR